MSLIYVDGFDSGSAQSDLAVRGWSVVNTNVSFSASTRFGVGKAMVVTSNSAGSVRRLIDAGGTKSSWVCGFAWSPGAPAPYSILASFQENSTTHLTVGTDSSGAIVVTRGDGTVLATSSKFVAGASAGGVRWYYIEIKFTIHSSTGSYEVRVDSVPWVQASGVNTRNGGTGIVNYLNLGVNSFVSGSLFDDLYVCDSLGSSNNDFLGDTRIWTARPTSAGSTTQFSRVGTGLSANWDAVDDSTQDGDTTYVTASGVNDTDTYNHADLAISNGSIRGVQLVMIARMDATGEQLAGVCVSNAVSQTGASQALTTTYAQYTEMFPTDPNTSVAWTQSGFNAAEFGQKKAA